MRTNQAVENPVLASISGPRKDRSDDGKSSSVMPFDAQLKDRMQSKPDQSEKTEAVSNEGSVGSPESGQEASAAAANAGEEQAASQVDQNADPAATQSPLADMMAAQLMALLALQQQVQSAPTARPTMESVPEGGEIQPLVQSTEPEVSSDRPQVEGLAKDAEAVFAARADEGPEKFAVQTAFELRRGKGLGGVGPQQEAQAHIGAAAVKQEVVHAPQQHGVAVKVESTVGTAAWGPEVGQKVVLMVGGKQQSMEMQLNPPQLGPLEVKLTLNQDLASVSFITAHGQVREALLQTVPKLGEMLADNGVMLANVQVDVGGAGSQPGFGHQSAGRDPGRSSHENGAEPLGRVVTSRLPGVPGQVSLFV